MTGRTNATRTGFAGFGFAGSAISVLALAFTAQDETGPADAAGIEYFETKIRPLLADRCVDCHGPKKQKSGLRLDTPAWIAKGGERGPVLVPGDPDASPLIRAIRYTDEDLQMPERGKLPDAEIEELTAWVERGAPMPAATGVVQTANEFDLEERKKHWSFQPVRRVEPPAPKGTGWIRNEIDAFVLAGLEADGLSPAAPAEKRALLRRVSFALTGLPPTPEELDAFLADEAPDAYERLVDRLLASPRYGERWARHWLDLVRYAETRGHEFDLTIPNAYQYRDYVIRAFNADVPYDTFVTEHVAGDLVETPRTHPEEGFDESVLGTGFWFLGEATHSPVDIRGDETDRVANQLDVFSKSFLGLTVACARCHDHKFDAITTRDYYSLAGFSLSSSYRQVRFDTRQHNRRIAESLWDLERDYERRVVTALRADLESAGANGSGRGRFARRLMAAREMARAEAGELPATDTIPEGIDLLFEDFEGDLDGWVADGDAFRAVPLWKDQVPDNQGDVRAKGNGLVNSHATPGADGERVGDAATGTLTSPAFVIERDYIHFLVGGGSHAEKTCVELVVDGNVVRSATGFNANAMRPRFLEVTALVGSEARLRIADRHEEGWGNIGVDHIVFSDDPTEAALETFRSPAEEAGRWKVAADIATREGVAAEDVLAWAEAMRRAADDPADPLHVWGAVASVGEEEGATFEGSLSAALEALDSNERREASQPVEVLFDYGSPTEPPTWLQEGFAFGRGSKRTGALRFDWRAPDDAPLELVAGVVSHGAAKKDATWDVLELAPGTEREPGRLSWIQSGRMLRTPSFRVPANKLYYLVRGAGHVYAAVDSHRLNQGPLHGALARSWGDEGLRWVAHDLSDYEGHLAHLEFSPRDPKDGAAPPLEIVRIVTSAEAPAPPGPNALVLERIASSGASSAEELARVYEEAFAESVQLLGTDLVTPDVAAFLDRAVGAPRLAPLASTQLAEVLDAYRSERSALTQEIQRVSRVAPAMIDGNGVDEHVLVRGSHRSPGDAAPRGFLEAVAGHDQPPPVSGSGRLELARHLVDPDNPFLARVMVNRVWKHLFGRGLVSSVDDFGVMGEEPTHPELLDYLARRFMDDGWSTKKLIRLLVTSQAYRMSSRSSAEAEERDPLNESLHRMPVIRLEAEALRDAMLAVAGNLNETMYGPSVPVHLTPFMEGRGRPGKSGPVDGEGRRSLYLAVRRNFLVPMFLVFDFPAPATTMGRRGTSNVPAQALTLMNDPFVALQAERWAEALLAESDRSSLDRLHSLYRAAFARPPVEEEVQDALAFLVEQSELRGVPTDDVRVWADLCHVLFNVKEFLFLE